jgi:hypothetical protein
MHTTGAPPREAVGTGCRGPPDTAAISAVWVASATACAAREVDQMDREGAGWLLAQKALAHRTGSGVTQSGRQWPPAMSARRPALRPPIGGGSGGEPAVSQRRRRDGSSVRARRGASPTREARWTVWRGRWKRRFADRHFGPYRLSCRNGRRLGLAATAFKSRPQAGTGMSGGQHPWQTPVERVGPALLQRRALAHGAQSIPVGGPHGAPAPGDPEGEHGGVGPRVHVDPIDGAVG